MASPDLDDTLQKKDSMFAFLGEGVGEQQASKMDAQSYESVMPVIRPPIPVSQSGAASLQNSPTAFVATGVPTKTNFDSEDVNADGSEQQNLTDTDFAPGSAESNRKAPLSEHVDVNQPLDYDDDFGFLAAGKSSSAAPFDISSSETSWHEGVHTDYPSNESSEIWPLLVVIAVLVSGLGSYYAYEHFQQKTIQSAVTPSSSDTAPTTLADSGQDNIPLSESDTTLSENDLNAADLSQSNSEGLVDQTSEIEVQNVNPLDVTIITSPNAVSLGDRFKEQLAALEKLVSDGELEQAQSTLRTMNRSVYGYGALEFGQIEDRIDNLVNNNAVASQITTEASESEQKQAQAAAEQIDVERTIEAEQAALRAEAERLAAAEAVAAAEAEAEAAQRLQEQLAEDARIEQVRLEAEAEKVQRVAIAQAADQEAQVVERRADQERAAAEAERLILRLEAAAERKASQPAEAEAETTAQAEAEQLALVDAERIAQDEDARLAQIEAERLAQVEAERLAQVEAERLAQVEAERLAQVEAERLAQVEAERLAQVEAERLAQVEAERLAQVEAERLAQVEAERLAQVEAERLAQVEAERLAQVEAERLAQAEAERLAQVEAERLAQVEAERLAQVEAERLAQAEAERLAQVEAERLAQAEADRLVQAEADRLAQVEAERVAQVEEARVAQAEAARLAEVRAAELARQQAQQRIDARAAEAERVAEVARAARARARLLVQQADQQQLALAETVAEPLQRAPEQVRYQVTDGDFQQVYERFLVLERAVESRDIEQVIALTQQSRSRVQQLLQLFENSVSIEARISNVATRSSEATITGRLNIQKLIRSDGQEVEPPENLSTFSLSSKYESNGWSAISW